MSNTTSIKIEWSTEDVQMVAPRLTGEQCGEVLDFILRTHDADIGINWEVIACAADTLFPVK